MTNYYNEHDPKAAQWLRNLIDAGHIAPGIVDERSIEDVLPSDLLGYTQCHFFAGIGVWSYALRRAGWPDDRPAWSGSCPCQPFSAAGKGAGFVDERHLWPAFHYLIEQCRPGIVFGEQIASADGLAWLDLVSADLEGAGYTVGALDTCAAGFGAPHIRQRLWFVGMADASSARSLPSPQHGIYRGQESAGARHGESERPCSNGGLANSDMRGRQQEPNAERAGILPEANVSPKSGQQSSNHSASVDPARQPGPTNGLWGDVDWLHCRDGKWRPVEPGTSPLVDGAAARVVRLRAYGNAICAPVAQAFIEAVMDSLGDAP